jgi:hypothetical protein
MAFRVDVDDDGKIEVFRPEPNMEHNVRTRHKNPEDALIMMRHWLSLDLEAAEQDRFVPQFMKDAKKAYNDFLKRSPFNYETKK